MRPRSSCQRETKMQQVLATLGIVLTLKQAVRLIALHLFPCHPHMPVMQHRADPPKFIQALWENVMAQHHATPAGSKLVNALLNITQLSPHAKSKTLYPLVLHAIHETQKKYEKSLNKHIFGLGADKKAQPAPYPRPVEDPRAYASWRTSGKAAEQRADIRAILTCRTRHLNERQKGRRGRFFGALLAASTGSLSMEKGSRLELTPELQAYAAVYLHCHLTHAINDPEEIGDPIIQVNKKKRGPKPRLDRDPDQYNYICAGTSARITMFRSVKDQVLERIDADKADEAEARASALGQSYPDAQPSGENVHTFENVSPCINF